jgi:voltage-gated potassium channel
VFVMDATLTPVFLGDFLYRFFTARSRTRYFLTGLGWIDLLSVVPGLRVLRIVRIVDVLRWMRGKGRGEVVEELAEQRATATFLITVFLVFVVVEVAGATIFAVESGDPNANIRTAGDALWWGLVTITTVGYGDRVPVTPGGRVIGVFLLFSGIALFSVFTGFIANVFLAPRHRRLRREPRDDTRAAIASLRELLADQEERTDQIRQRIDDLERSLRTGAKGGTTGTMTEEAAE